MLNGDKSFLVLYGTMHDKLVSGASLVFDSLNKSPPFKDPFSPCDAESFHEHELSNFMLEDVL